jgi:hypothetical protein
MVLNILSHLKCHLQNIERKAGILLTTKDNVPIEKEALFNEPARILRFTLLTRNQMQMVLYQEKNKHLSIILDKTSSTKHYSPSLIAYITKVQVLMRYATIQYKYQRIPLQCDDMTPTIRLNAGLTNLS